MLNLTIILINTYCQSCLGHYNPILFIQCDLKKYTTKKINKKKKFYFISYKILM